MRLALAASCLIFAAAVPAREEPKAAQTPTAVAETDVRALLARLAEKTDHLRSFVATYRAKSDDLEMVFRLVYQAPGRAKCEGHGAAMNFAMWVLDDHLS